MDVKAPAGRDSEECGKCGYGKPYHLRKYIYGHKQTAARNTNVKGSAGENSEGNEEHVTGYLKKGDFCSIV